MELYFVRHGMAAERALNGGDDASRALTEDGMYKMRQVARGLRKLDVIPNMLLSSPVLRAAQTADIIATELGLPVRITDPLAPGCSLDDLATVLAPYQSVKRIMLVGHEPDWSEIIGDIAGGKVEMKKGAVCRVDCGVVVAGVGRLVWLLPPKVLREVGAK